MSLVGRPRYSPGHLPPHVGLWNQQADALSAQRHGEMLAGRRHALRAVRGDGSGGKGHRQYSCVTVERQKIRSGSRLCDAMCEMVRVVVKAGESAQR